MGSGLRSKKMALFEPVGPVRRNWTSQAENGPHHQWRMAFSH
jgi:hypothetical protein